ncbi:MAG: DUF1553 domain-containing protein [Pirellulales bacterium]
MSPSLLDHRRLIVSPRSRLASLPYLALLAAACLTMSLPQIKAADTPRTQGDKALAESLSQINDALADHWTSDSLQAAEPAAPTEWLRRVTLDLVGRPPTAAEVKRLESDKNGKTNPTEDRQATVIDSLLDSPEFALYFGTVLDELIQGRQAGSEQFVDYLRRSLVARRSWDHLFREIVGGQSEAKESSGGLAAALFYDKRSKDIDQLTVDTARAFFGVDISCARCHDHPLVSDWTQFHYYGLAAFLQRPASGGKGSEKAGKDAIVEVKFVARDGKEQTATRMFLTGKKLDVSTEPAEKEPAPSSRERLVEMAIEDRAFLSRAFVNRLWEYFHGRGLVEPVDQMHSGNPASIPKVLDALADDFASSGYDVRRAIRLVVLNRAYRATSRWEGASPIPESRHFAVMRLKPLTPRQLALSLVVTVGAEATDEPLKTDERLERVLGTPGIARGRRWLEWESKTPSLVGMLDPRIAAFQSSAREALFVSNGEAIRQLIGAGENSLANRAAQRTDDQQAIELVFRTLLQRSPDDDELRTCKERWAASQSESTTSRPTRVQWLEELIWAVTASVEFRFNH